MLRLIISILIFLFCSIVSYAQYTGGSNDGFTGTLKTAQNILPNIYTGGANDGFVKAENTNQNSLPNIYKGGQNDGYAQSSINNQNPIVNIYSGGVNDGFNTTIVSVQNPLTNIFVGGINDGFASTTISNLNATASIYSGGIGDGFTMNQFENQNTLTNIYTGGINDGFATLIVLDQNSIGVVPITLLSFNAMWQAKNAKITWKVTDEINVHHYELERSGNGVSFTTVKKETALNNLQETNYEYVDFGAASLGVPVIFYRLKTINKDGSFEYSAIIRLSVNPADAVMIVYPNPTKGNFTLRLTNFSNQHNYEYALLTSQGTLISKGKIINTQTDFNISSQAAGVYILTITKQGKRIQNFNIILTK